MVDTEIHTLNEQEIGRKRESGQHAGLQQNGDSPAAAKEPERAEFTRLRVARLLLGRPLGQPPRLLQFLQAQH